MGRFSLAVSPFHFQHVRRFDERFRVGEVFGVAVVLVVFFGVAMGMARPHMRVLATSSDLGRVADGFGQLEQSDYGWYRWLGADGAVRLFGFERRAPLLVSARLSAQRVPGQEVAQVTIVGGQAVGPFSVGAGWRRYVVVVPMPHHGDEVGVLLLRSSTVGFPGDNRVLGFAFDWFDVRQVGRGVGVYVPDVRRLVFLVMLGVLGYVAVRCVCVVRVALLAVGGGWLALAVGLVWWSDWLAWWVPNVWLLVGVGWLLVLIPVFEGRLRPWGGHYQVPVRVLGVVLMGVAVWVLPLGEVWSRLIGWGFLVGGGVMVMATLPPDALAGQGRVGGRVVVAGLGVCTLLALGLRLFDLDRLPLGLWRDEARGGLHAFQIMSDPGFRPVYLPVTVDVPALLFYLATVPIGLFGAQAWTIRFVPALVGGLTPLTLFFAARPLFGERVGLLAAGLLAVSAWHIGVSRLAFAAALSPPVTLLALGLVWRMMEAPNVRRGLVLAVLAGGCTGLALYVYHPSRLTPVVVVLTVVVVLGRDVQRWRAMVVRLVVLGVVACIVAWPMVDYALTQPELYVRRLGQTSLFSDTSRVGYPPAVLIEENVGRVLGMWNERGDGNGRHNVAGAPQLDGVTGVAFAVGVALMLARLRDRRWLWLLVWFGVMLVPGVLSVKAPHAIRNVEVIPPTFLLAGLGGGLLAEFVNMGWLRRGRWRVQAVLVVVMGGVLVLNGWRYFVVWPSTPAAYGEFYVGDTMIGDVVQRLARTPEFVAGGYEVFVPAVPTDEDVMSYVTMGVSVGRFHGNYFSRLPGAHAVLIAYGDQPTRLRDQALEVLGSGSRQVGVGPRSPLTGLPEFVVYGDDVVAPVVARVLATWRW